MKIADAVFIPAANDRTAVMEVKMQMAPPVSFFMAVSQRGSCRFHMAVLGGETKIEVVLCIPIQSRTPPFRGVLLGTAAFILLGRGAPAPARAGEDLI